MTLCVLGKSRGGVDSFEGPGQVEGLVEGPGTLVIGAGGGAGGRRQAWPAAWVQGSDM